MIRTVEQVYGQADGIWIMDRGMGSAETLNLLSQENRHYILGTPKNLLKKFNQELGEGTWKSVHPGLEVKLCQSLFGNDREVFILCQSTSKPKKRRFVIVSLDYWKPAFCASRKLRNRSPPKC